ncbi:MAG: hypothetical protein U9R48_05965 [Chloroflexota bacterium]|nr:hypothetical protein [Chloroflexota bacterium]
MKKAIAILMVLASIPFLTFGIIFMIAAAGGASGSRILVGLALLAIGAALLISGIRWLRRLAALSTDALKAGAVQLARRLGGELTVSHLRAEYRISRERAGEVLEALAAEGSCERERRDTRLVYVFEGLGPSLSEKRCPYCGTKLPVNIPVRQCPNCGAQLEIRKT